MNSKGFLILMRISKWSSEMSIPCYSWEFGVWRRRAQQIVHGFLHTYQCKRIKDRVRVIGRKKFFELTWRQYWNLDWYGLSHFHSRCGFETSNLVQPNWVFGEEQTHTCCIEHHSGYGFQLTFVPPFWKMFPLKWETRRRIKNCVVRIQARLSFVRGRVKIYRCSWFLGETLDPTLSWQSLPRTPTPALGK